MEDTLQFPQILWRLQHPQPRVCAKAKWQQGTNMGTQRVPNAALPLPSPREERDGMH